MAGLLMNSRGMSVRRAMRRISSVFVGMFLTASVVLAGPVDPTRPLVVDLMTSVDDQVPSLVMPTLNFVLVNSQRRIAIIDGERYQENDQFQGFTLVKIWQRRVTLAKDGKMVDIELPTLVFGSAAEGL
jgi:hypothetical protein